MNTDVTFERVAPAVWAIAAGVAAVAASYGVAGTSSAFVVAPVAALVVAFTPDAVVTASITLLRDFATVLATGTAVAVTVAVLAAGALPGVRLTRSTAAGGLLAGVVVAAVTGLLTAAPVSAVAAGAGAALVVVVPRAWPSGAPDAEGRRQVLAAVGTALATGVLGAAAAPRDAGTGVGDGGAGEMAASSGAETAAALSAAETRSLDVDGLEPLVSETGDFYTVDIAQFDPNVDADDWSLTVTGNVGEERTYDFADLTDREPEHRFVTLRCVSDTLNGGKIDTALWTGVPVWDLVAPADPADDCCVRLHAEDDYYQVFPLEALRRSFLAYGMNGQALPRGHGAPARVLAPGHWGEINVKWVTEIEVLDEAVDGYWEERGWHGTGPVNTVAKLWATNRLDDGRVEIAGHAYAGTRGVERVEVSTDGGDTWTEATLSEPLPVVGDPPDTPAPTPTPAGMDETADAGTSTPTPSGEDETATPDAERTATPPDAAGVATPTPDDVTDHGDVAVRGRDVWRQWVHRYDPPDGSHEVVVRAVDGTGTVQPREQSGAFPSGATGWVTETVDP